MTRLFRFAVGGVVGLLVDTGVLYALLALGVGPYLARVPSFLVAATSTWLVNRYWTFADRRGAGMRSEWTRYLAAMAVGGLINYATYAWLMATVALVAEWPVLGVAAGSLAGMTINFLSSNYWIFRPAPSAGPRH